MRQNEKDLLLKDLCMRLPYSVKGEKYTIRMDGEFVPLIDVEIITAEDIITLNGCPGYTIKPYLFPLSSITEEQKNELSEMEWSFDNSTICNILECFGTYRAYVDHSCCFELIDWLNKNHFDYRNLIPMELANDATNLNIY